MKNLNKEDFLRKSTETLEEIFHMLSELPVVYLKDLKSTQTVLIIIDMINGFAREGALKSQRTENLIPEIVKLSKACDDKGIFSLAFADHHTDKSPEFDSYPVHCMAGTYESEVVDEIKEIGGYKLILKNSTNGFLEDDFQRWLKENQHVDTFIISGVCTDICIQQFSITLKAWFNMNNKRARVIVPMNMVDTYDLDMHNADLTHVMSLYNMIINGVEIVRRVE